MPRTRLIWPPEHESPGIRCHYEACESGPRRTRSDCHFSIQTNNGSHLSGSRDAPFRHFGPHPPRIYYTAAPLSALSSISSLALTLYTNERRDCDLPFFLSTRSPFLKPPAAAAFRVRGFARPPGNIKGIICWLFFFLKRGLREVLVKSKVY